MRAFLVSGWVALTSLSLLGACGPANVEGDDGTGVASENEPVGETSQALGGWSVVYSPPEGEHVLHVGPKYSIVSRAYAIQIQGIVLPYHVPEVVLTATGEKLAVTPLPFPSLPFVDYAVSDANNLVFLHRGSRRVYAYRPATPTSGSWAQIATLNESYFDTAYLNGTHVYVDLEYGIVRARLTGNIPITQVPSSPENIDFIPNSQNWKLLGVDSQYLYIAEPINGGKADIKRSTTSGNSATLAAQVSYPDGLTSDGSYYYFTDWDPSTGTSRIRRMNKVGYALSTVKSSTAVNYSNVYSTGSMFYWLESSVPSGGAGPLSIELRRKNLTNGNHVTVSFPFEALAFTATTGGIYVRDASINRGSL